MENYEKKHQRKNTNENIFQSTDRNLGFRENQSDGKDKSNQRTKHLARLSHNFEDIQKNLMKKNFGFSEEDTNENPNSLSASMNFQSERMRQTISNSQNQMTPKEIQELLEKVRDVLCFSATDFLKKIFLVKKNGDLSNLIINSAEINNLLLNLFYSKNENELTELIEYLIPNFQENKQNVDLFTNATAEVFIQETSEVRQINLYQILIDQINCPLINFEKDQNFILLICRFLEILATEADCNKETFEIVFQQLAGLFFNSKNLLVCPKNNEISEEFENSFSREAYSLTIKKNISILKSLFSKSFFLQKPYNYFYFSGKNNLQVDKENLLEEKISLRDGFSVFFWVKLDWENSNEMNLENNLMKIKTFNKTQIILSLTGEEILIRNSEYNSTKNPKICSHQHYFFKESNSQNNGLNDNWVFICCTFKKKSSKKAIVKFYINNSSNEYPTDKLEFENDIQEMILFDKFCGSSTSFMFFDSVLEEKQVELIKNQKKGFDIFHGFSTENKLAKFLRKVNPKHLENSDFNKIVGVYDNQNTNYHRRNSVRKSNLEQNTNTKKTNFEILNDSMTKSLRIFYTPMRKRNNKIYDLTNCYNAEISQNENILTSGIRLYHNIQNNIFLIGGINNILPILELMWQSNSYKENFIDYMELIFNILNEREKNMKDAVEKNFFQIMSIFLEKFDNEIFNEKLYLIFKDLLRHLFSFVDKNDLCKVYIDNILLNVKILLKFEINLQIEIWKTLYQCFVSDPTEIYRFINIKKLSSIILEYDKNHYFEYCCVDHKNNFLLEENIAEVKSKEVMNPTLNEKMKNVLMILNLMLRELDISNNTSDLKSFKNFINLLILDISPCLQKGIITILIEYFRKSTSNSDFILESLIDSNLIQYLLFNYSISLIDVRCFILALIKVIISNKIVKEKEKTNPFINEMVEFVYENLLPTNLKAFNKDVFLNPNLNKEKPKNLMKKNTRGISMDIKKLGDNFNFDEITEEGVLPKKENKNISNISIEENNFEYNQEEESVKITEKEVEDFVLVSNEKIKKKGIETKLKPKLKNFNFNLDMNKIIENESHDNKSDGLESPTSNPFDNKDLPFSYRQMSGSNEIEFDPTTPRKNVFEVNTKEFTETEKESEFSLNSEIKKDTNTNTEIESNLEDSTKLSTEKKPIIEENINSKIKSSNIKTSGGFSMSKKRNTTLGGKMQRKGLGLGLGLDIESINEKYQFGGGENNQHNQTEEETQKNLEEKIKSLADHCIKFMNGEVNEVKCLNFSSDIFFRDKEIETEDKTLQNKVIEKIKPSGLSFSQNQIENVQSTPKEPNTMRGLQKISFNLPTEIKFEKQEKTFEAPDLDSEVCLMPMKKVFEKKSIKKNLQISIGENKIEEKEENISMEKFNAFGNKKSFKKPILEIKEENENEENFLFDEIPKNKNESDIENNSDTEKNKNSFDENLNLKETKNPFEENLSQLDSNSGKKNLSESLENQKKPAYGKQIQNKSCDSSFTTEKSFLKGNKNTEKEVENFQRKNSEGKFSLKSQLFIKNQEQEITNEIELSDIIDSHSNYENFSENDLVDLSLYLSREKYTKYLHILLVCCLELLTNREFNDCLFPIFSDKFNFSNLLSEFEEKENNDNTLDSSSITSKYFRNKKENSPPLIVNQDFLNVLIKITQRGNFAFTYRFLIEIQVLIHESQKNSLTLSTNDDFYCWFIELIFNSFLLYKNQKINLKELESSSNENNDEMIFNNFLNELNSIFILGKKINTKVISDLFNSLQDNPLKRVNFLLNWAHCIKSVNMSQYNVNGNTINEFVRILLEDIFDTVKENLFPPKENLKDSKHFSSFICNSPTWENFASFTILLYEFTFFFNGSENQHFFSLENETLNLIPENIILALNMQSLNKIKEEDFKNCDIGITEADLEIIQDGNQKNEHKENKKLKESINKENYLNEKFHSLPLNPNIAEEWIDYNLFYKVYQYISKVWMESNLIREIVADKKIKHLKDEYLIEEFVLKKSNRDMFVENIKFLFYTNSWNSEIISPSFMQNNSQKKSASYQYPFRANSYFNNSVNRFNMNPPNYKNQNSMMNLHTTNNSNNYINNRDSTISSTKESLNIDSKNHFNSYNDFSVKENHLSVNNTQGNNYNIYDIPLIKVLHNFIVISINLSKEIDVFNYWLNEYEKFLIFLIFGSTNMTKENSDAYNYYQESIIDILLFAINHFVKLIESLTSNHKKENLTLISMQNLYLITKNNNRTKSEKFLFYNQTNEHTRKAFADKIEKSLTKIFSYMVLIYSKINAVVNKKRKKFNFISNLISSKKDDFSICAIYRFFTEILIDQKEQIILTAQETDNLIMTFFVNIMNFFKKENVYKRLFLSSNLNERISKVFDMNLYMNILKIRTSLSENYKNIEMHTLLNQKKTNSDSIIQNLKNERYKGFENNTDSSIQENANKFEDGDKYNQKEKNLKSKKRLSFEKRPAYDNEKFLISDLNYSFPVFRNIEKSLRKFITDIKEIESQELCEAKEKRLTYKLVKKKIFSWRGLWADKELFFKYSDRLKFKTLNHFTSTFSKPFLIHILDLEYHLPKFTSFDYKKNLLLENNKNSDYHICLDITKILNNDSEKCNTNNFDINLSNKTTFIFDIYKLTSKNIWKAYSEIINLRKKYKLCPEEEYFTTITEKFKERKTNIKINPNEYIFDCCYVKKCHHIQGIFQINKEGITFRLNLSRFTNGNCSNDQNKNNFSKLGSFAETKRSNFSEESNTNFISKLSSKISIDVMDVDVHYDDQRKTCVGSYITYHKKDLEKLFRNFPYQDMKYIFKRNYYLRKSGLEIFISNKSYFFNFKCQKDRDNALKEILSNFDHKKEIRYDSTMNKSSSEKENVIGYENLAKTLPNYSLSQIKKMSKSETIMNKIEMWSILKISNFEMLMWLNILSNRSFSDISQYPVFPWILKNYSKNNLDLSKDLRDLDKPMGMMCTDDKGKGKERSINYKEMFNNTRDDFNSGDSSSMPYCYGHTYSNPMYVTHYLTRIFPYSQIAVELQGSSFDDPNRLFLSIENSFYCSTTQKGDVRELVPEFFCLPEIFYNFNNINFGERISNIEKTIVNDVGLPSWSDGNGYKFVTKMKESLESQEVSDYISKWMDLIFGFRQRGKEAEECHNVFLPSAYGIDSNLEEIEKDERTTALTMVEIGLVPSQITCKEIPKRLTKDYVRSGKQITESSTMKIGKYTDIIHSKTKSYNKDKKQMVHLKVLSEDNNLICIFGNNQLFTYKMMSDSAKTIDNFVYQDGLFRVQNKMYDLYNETNTNSPICVFGKGKQIACGGYWDGGIRVINLENTTKKNVNIYSTVESPNVCLTIDKDEKYAFAGSMNGILSIFKIDKNYIWIKEKELVDHNSEISFIFISNNLNILATSCIDGYVNLYTFDNFHFLRSIKLPLNISANYVFLSNNPLPVVSIFSTTNYIFYNFTINGKKINEVFEEKVNLLSPHVFTDISFNDYLIYGTNNGLIKMRKFPEMNIPKGKSIKLGKKSDESIKCLDLTEDKKSILIWNCNSNQVSIISDPSETSEAATHNLRSMGLG